MFPGIRRGYWISVCGYVDAFANECFFSAVIEEAALQRLGGCQALLSPEGSSPLHQAR